MEKKMKKLILSGLSAITIICSAGIPLTNNAKPEINVLVMYTPAVTGMGQYPVSGKYTLAEGEWADIPITYSKPHHGEYRFSSISYEIAPKEITFRTRKLDIPRDIASLSFEKEDGSVKLVLKKVAESKEEEKKD